MRNYRFRIWNPATETMTYNVGLDRISEYADETLVKMQMTGLKDKRGNNIYEGDVLKHCNPHWGHKQEQLRVVEWESKTSENGQLMNCGFAFKQVGKGFFTYYSPEADLELISNIYETPELLTQENGEEVNV